MSAPKDGSATCKHVRGDWIKEMGFWLCADCFDRRDGPVVRYGFNSQVIGSEYRQSIIWQSATAKADNTTLNDFLRAMSRRIMNRTRPAMMREDAYDAAINILKDLVDPYGDTSYDWSPCGAKELVDDEMMYWDADNYARN